MFYLNWVLKIFLLFTYLINTIRFPIFPANYQKRIYTLLPEIIIQEILDFLSKFMERMFSHLKDLPFI